MSLEVEKFSKLMAVLDTLLDENGCQWCKTQRIEDLITALVEETAEAVDAVKTEDMANLCEELGDVLMLVLFMARVSEKGSGFTLSDVIDRISDKLIRRHTHVFGNDKAYTPEEAMRLWQLNKGKEKN
jgi:uncharacterized protein YabN with tetrapyrrole methylase and pyrophosphatase domain